MESINLDENIECLIRSYDTAIVALLKIVEAQEKRNERGEELIIAQKALGRIESIHKEFGMEDDYL